MKIFVLDDELHSGGLEQRDQLKTVLAGHNLTLATSCEDGKAKFNPPYDLMLLDYDMEGVFGPADHPNTGLQFVKWMVTVKQPAPLPQIVLHSVNGKNRAKMAEVLDEYGIHYIEFPFNKKYVEFLKASFSLEQPVNS